MNKIMYLNKALSLFLPPPPLPPPLPCEEVGLSMATAVTSLMS